MFTPEPEFSSSDNQSHPDAACGAGTRFWIRAEANAAIFARILNEFARRDLIPERCQSRRTRQLEIDIEVGGLSAPAADLLAAKLRTMVDVDTVTALTATRVA